MKYQVAEKGNTVTARISGQMTFSDRGEVSELSLALMRGNLPDIIVDLSAVEYIDSAGLGILLILREAAQEKGRKITLSGMTGSVKEVLELACFDTLFTFKS
ncbi:MAG: STAS domain-containing protein [Rhodospirillales bacterium]